MKPAMIALATALAAPVLACAQTQTNTNILFYGNSFTYFAGGVDQVVHALADASGHPVYTYSAAYGGASFEFHVLGNYGIIYAAAPENEHWDWVVLQGYSTELTHIGSPLNARTNGVRLFNGVKQHSPNVKACLYETWARAPGFSFYSPPDNSFPFGPAQMQAELRSGYQKLAADIAYFNTPETVRVARAGDAWELSGWNNLHSGDLYHQNPRGCVLSGMVIFSTIFQRTISSFDINGVCDQFGISHADGQELAALADAISAQGPLPLPTPPGWTPLNLNPPPPPPPSPPPPPPPYCPAVDFNSDGNVNPDDLADFITAFFTDPQPEEADFNHSGVIDPDDLGDFITQYFGCH